MIASPQAGGPPERTDDQIANGAANFGFGVALSIGAVALPLVALAAGYDAAAVGLLTAASALSQLSVRLVLPRLLRRYPDRALMLFASGLLSLSYALLLVSTAAPVFVGAQALQGAARGLFWTGSQTHAVRGTGGTVRRLAQMQLMGNLGTLAGPALAGLLASFHLPLALVAGVVASAISALISLALRHLPPFQRREAATRGDLWRNPDVLLGSFANFTAGGWRSLLGSYVPVILAASGYGPAIIGLLLAAADAASVVASAILVPFQARRPGLALRVGIALMGFVVAAVPFAAADAFLAGLLLVIGGAGSGVVVVLAPALVSDAVEPEARGEALSIAGTLRASALLISPAGIALALSFVPLSWAMVGAGIVIGGPPLAIGSYLRRGRRRAAGRSI